MSVTHALARPLIAGMFIMGGVDALKRPESKVPAAEGVAPPIARTFGLPDDTEQLVRINGAVQVGAGTLLALGKLPRLSALALAASLVPTTLAGHRFWEQDDPGARTNHQIHFFKNVSMLGGLLLAATDTDGRPSVAWRTRRAARHAGHRVHEAASQARQVLPGAG